eukprot:2382277-Prymnesium_polylepis.1
MSLTPFGRNRGSGGSRRESNALPDPSPSIKAAGMLGRRRSVMVGSPSVPSSMMRKGPAPTTQLLNEMAQVIAQIEKTLTVDAVLALSDASGSVQRHTAQVKDEFVGVIRRAAAAFDTVPWDEADPSIPVDDGIDEASVFDLFSQLATFVDRAAATRAPAPHRARTRAPPS